MLDVEAGDPEGGGRLAHLHRGVDVHRGSADEPAAELHRLKADQGATGGGLLEEEKAVQAVILVDLLQRLLAVLLTDTENRDAGIK